MGCNMCVVQQPEEQHRVMLQVSGKEPARRGRGRGGPREPLVLQVLRRRPPHAGPPPPGPAPPHPWGGPGPGPPPAGGLVDSGTQTDISFGGAEPPPAPPDCLDPADLGEPERPEELEYEEVQLCKPSHRDKLGLTVCYRTDGEEDAGIYVGEVNPNSIAAKDGRIREGDRIVQINGVEVQDREEAVAALTREQQTSVSLLLARPESRRWKDSDREDFLDDFGSEEEGGPRGPWTPPGQPPSPATPGARGAEPDSGVGRTDESTRNEESSEHDLLGDEGQDGPPPRAPPRRAPPRRPAASPGGGRPGSGSSSGSSGRPGAGAGPSPGAGSLGRPGAGAGPSPGAGSLGRPGAGAGPSPGAGSLGRPGAAAAGFRASSGAGSGARPGGGSAPPPGAGLSPAARAGAALSPGAAPGPLPLPLPPPPPPAGLSQAELRRYRQLRGRLGAAAAGRAELALLEEELRHLEFKCRHLLRAQKMERLRERCLRAWLEAAGAEPPLADISEAPERDSSSAYNTGESCRSSPLLRGLGAAAAGPAGGKAARGKRPGRDRLLKARAIRIMEERGGSTTDDDARSELKTGRYWSREQRKQHLARAREQRRRRELLLQTREAGPGNPPGGNPHSGIPPAGNPLPGNPPEPAPPARRGLRKRSRRILDNWVTIQEMLARGGDGACAYNPLLSVTTV